jgi:hypothetical protein
LHGGAEGQVANEEGRSRFHLSSWRPETETCVNKASRLTTV